MKAVSISILLIFFNIISVCGKDPTPADKEATRETVNLFRSMYKLQNTGVMYGHQDDLMYGSTWWNENERSDTKDFTGDYPAVAGFELGHLELGNERSLDSVSFTDIIQQIKAHYKRGGIITISWHPKNPLTMQNPDSKARAQGGTAWDVSSKDVVASILPGGKNNKLFNTWLDRLATFIGKLKDDKGTPIPFIFRPYHEHSGSFFWWGTNICTDKQYSDLWKYTVRYLRDRKNIHNILYAYNTDRVTTLDQYMRGYPGDEFIDMLSIDMYDRGEKFGQELDNALGFVTLEAEKRGKLSALSETGPGKNVLTWWSSIILPVVTKYPVGYVLTWRHSYKSKYTMSGGYEKPFPDDFMIFYKSPRTLFLKEIQDYNVYRKK